MGVNELALLQNYLVVGALLFGIGMIGFLSRRNMIVMFLSAELMLQGISVSLVAWGRFQNGFGGQMLVIFIIAVAACEAAIALAMALTLFAQTGKLDVAAWNELHEEGQLPPSDADLPPEPPEPQPDWPKLAPAGIRPETSPNDTDYRRHV